VQGEGDSSQGRRNLDKDADRSEGRKRDKYEHIKPTPGIAEVTAMVNSFDSKTCQISASIVVCQSKSILPCPSSGRHSPC
jgi:hypothetical protein